MSIDYERSYEYVTGSGTDVICGGVGAVGDILERVICVVNTAATSQVRIRDSAGGTLMTILNNAVGGGVGVYPIELNLTSKLGGWAITTSAGVSAMCIGKFST